MGMDITVMVVDWAYLERLPWEERLDLLRDAAYSDLDPDGTGDRDPTDWGWIWPAAAEGSWLGRYEFQGTLGSYKDHFSTAHAWDHLREAVPAEPRRVIDEFLGALIWWGPDPGADLEHVDAGVFPVPDDTGRSDALIARTPDTATRLARAWEQVRPVLSHVDEAWRLQGALSASNSVPDAAHFSRLVSGWGNVTAEAHRRGWGIIGLR
ncbi:hypothetical protein [Streptomyces clavuligerus]|uniref:hypothetical protein n=1 Tax=Streptomyces clavuligerus TaxID=1901 RepID=UPI0001800806|nr:hypothetical protein [Streptomyces clavuligerus]EDY52953.1 conserved hypothetical protein [Streptomyces clavuligerus]WDN55919.1 hypothetical protein LL058_28905 [Streptomyces clavuligerus]